MQLRSKLPSTGTTIFTVMSSLAAEYNAVNLGQGFPDYPMSEDLMALVTKAMLQGHNQYVHMNGLPLLRDRLAQKYRRLYDANVDPDTQITVTPGGTYAIYTALTTVLHHGDEVIVFEPAYDSYIPAIEMNGAKAVRIALEYPSYSIPWQEVRANVNAKTRMIVINSPHNPTGSVLSEDDMRQLHDLVKDTDIIILSDEVYEHLIFDGIPHQSIVRYPELLRRSFVCFSFGKTYHCTGWKMGYCIAAPELMKEFRKVHQFNCFTCNSPAQYALAEYLLEEKTYLSLSVLMQAKRDHFRELMKATLFVCIPSHGSYFECYSYEGLSNKSDKDFAIHLTKEYGVATIPVSAFFADGNDNKVIRFCFAKKEATLETAVERLRKFR